MRFIVVGLSFRTASVQLRERLAFASDKLGEALRSLQARAEIDECLLLSTCNRVEVFAVSAKPEHAARTIQNFFSEERHIPLADLSASIYVHENGAALSHIFRVAASLEAMVVGETQITGQVKDAYAAAAAAKTIGPWLSRLMHQALATAKRVRTDTDISRHPVSISSVAAELAGRVFGDISTSSVLVVGAGEMAELAVRHLLANGSSSICVINRTYERAVELAFSLGARAQRFEDLVGQLLLADIVITSTGSTQPLITRQLVQEVMRQRRQRPLFLVDIAVPRDIASEVGELDNVYLFNIDDLQQVVANNIKERQREARAAERIIEEEVERFNQWMREQDAVPAIKQLRHYFHEVARQEVSRAAPRLHLKTAQEQQALADMAEAIVHKLLHAPTMELKQYAAHPDGSFLARSVQRLFHLPSLSEADKDFDITNEMSEDLVDEANK